MHTRQQKYDQLLIKILEQGVVVIFVSKKYFAVSILVLCFLNQNIYSVDTNADRFIFIDKLATHPTLSASGITLTAASLYFLTNLCTGKSDRFKNNIHNLIAASGTIATWVTVYLILLAIKNSTKLKADLESNAHDKCDFVKTNSKTEMDVSQTETAHKLIVREQKTHDTASTRGGTRKGRLLFANTKDLR